MFNDAISPPFPQILIANDFYGLRFFFIFFFMSVLFSFSRHRRLLRTPHTTTPWHFRAVVRLRNAEAEDEAVNIFYRSIFVFRPSEQVQMTFRGRIIQTANSL